MPRKEASRRKVLRQLSKSRHLERHQPEELINRLKTKATPLNLTSILLKQKKTLKPRRKPRSLRVQHSTASFLLIYLRKSLTLSLK
jgi:hypothetical protein